MGAVVAVFATTLPLIVVANTATTAPGNLFSIRVIRFSFVPFVFCRFFHRFSQRKNLFLS